MSEKLKLQQQPSTPNTIEEEPSSKVQRIMEWARLPLAVFLLWSGAKFLPNSKKPPESLIEQQVEKLQDWMDRYPLKCIQRYHNRELIHHQVNRVAPAKLLGVMKDKNAPWDLLFFDSRGEGDTEYLDIDSQSLLVNRRGKGELEFCTVGVARVSRLEGLVRDFFPPSVALQIFGEERPICPAESLDLFWETIVAIETETFDTDPQCLYDDKEIYPDYNQDDALSPNAEPDSFKESVRRFQAWLDQHPLRDCREYAYFTWWRRHRIAKGLFVRVPEDEGGASVGWWRFFDVRTNPPGDLFLEFKNLTVELNQGKARARMCAISGSEDLDLPLCSRQDLKPFFDTVELIRLNQTNPETECFDRIF